MTVAKTTCGGCGERVSFLTSEDVDFLPCPECGKEYCVTPNGASPVGEISDEKQERLDRLREWEEEML
ncbi:hypothetical protein [Haloferax volcanii]|uniref:Uncharacterized protein n=1 Tax=Haloferax volcanii JCM 10717 TaxID=1227458 RepID=M0I9W9_HALVO|nr:hypothetical protein [Haloferax alexandrinus]ELZ93561.1 hypothetical protein C452_05053 [Haloferax alexandrinus JCM 10717]